MTTNSNTLTVGQEIAIIRHSSSFAPSCPCRGFTTITAVNKQFITVEGGRRFSIKTGKEWGQSESYYATEFSTNVKHWRAALAEQTQRRARDNAWYAIHEAVKNAGRRATADEVKAIQALLESYALNYTQE